MASLQEPETGSDKVLVTAPPNEVFTGHLNPLRAQTNFQLSALTYFE